MAEDKKSFFTYRGVPLVRKGDLDVANKVRIRKMATDPTVPPKDQIVKKAEKESLYEALDIACAWLKIS